MGRNLKHHIIFCNNWKLMGCEAGCSSFLMCWHFKAQYYNVLDKRSNHKSYRHTLSSMVSNLVSRMPSISRGFSAMEKSAKAWLNFFS